MPNGNLELPLSKVDKPASYSEVGSTRRPVGRERLNEDANKKYHTLESDEAVLRDTLRRYDDIRSLMLRVLSRVTKGIGEAQNEHSTLQKPRPVPRRVPMSK